MDVFAHPRTAAHAGELALRSQALWFRQLTSGVVGDWNIQVNPVAGMSSKGVGKEQWSRFAVGNARANL
jgi:hypothetical protein